MFGGTHVYREIRGEMQMVQAPGPREKLSEKQQVTVDRFKRAHNYAQGQMKDSKIKALYRKGVTNKLHTPYLVALSDSMNAPTVHYIKTEAYKGAVGDILTIKAKDDFKVVRVLVKITAANGKTLEQGEATRSIRKPLIWKYKASVVNPNLKGTVIKVRAFDMPDNEGAGESVL